MKWLKSWRLNIAIGKKKKSHVTSSYQKPELYQSAKQNKQLLMPQKQRKKYNDGEISVFTVTEILERFLDEFGRKTEVVMKLQTRSLHGPIGVWVSDEICDDVRLQTISRQTFFDKTHQIDFR